MLLAVNYHYISAERERGRAIVPVAVADFAAQLDELARNFEFVSRDDVLRAVDGTGSLPARGCLITFDDGLRDQVELALPVLEERGVPALFFVSGEPLDRRNVLYVHKVHRLREEMADDELLAALELEIGPAGVGCDSFSPAQAAAAYRYDSPGAASLKYLLNVVLGPHRPQHIDRLFSEAFSEAEVSERLYINEAQVTELESAGALGAHTYTHQPLAQLAPETARQDLERGAEVLSRITGVRPRSISYPYGTEAAVNAAVARAARASGFALGMTLERAFNSTLDEPLLLARIDANDAPGGREPLFAVDDDAITVRDGMTTRRERYLAEAA